MSYSKHIATPMLYTATLLYYSEKMCHLGFIFWPVLLFGSQDDIENYDDLWPWPLWPRVLANAKITWQKHMSLNLMGRYLIIDIDGLMQNVHNCSVTNVHVFFTSVSHPYLPWWSDV